VPVVVDGGMGIVSHTDLSTKNQNSSELEDKFINPSISLYLETLEEILVSSLILSPNQNITHGTKIVVKNKFIPLWDNILFISFSFLF